MVCAKKNYFFRFLYLELYGVTAPKVQKRSKNEYPPYYRVCVSEMVTEGKCATDHAYDTTDKVKVPNETLYSCLTFGRRKRL